jgi:melanoma-associated antigen p97
MCIPTEATPAAVVECTEALSLANNLNSGLRFSCVQGGSPEACMEAIQAGAADLTSFGAAELLKAKTDYDLEPIIAELYNNSTEATEYYSVAIVPASFCATGRPTFADLKGKNSCHTGYRKTAGFISPLGFLVDQNIAEVVSTDPNVQADAQTVANFFSEVCAPRVTADGPAVGGTAWPPLCTACGGDCTEDSIYYDYPGTLRGLMDGVCDVAFTKQDVALTYTTDGSAPAEWATGAKDDFRLLCPNGGCQRVENFSQCNLARVPSHAIVGNSALQTSALGRNIKAALTSAATNNPAFLAAVTEVADLPNFVLAAGTTGLKSQDLPFEEFFDAGLVSAFRGIEQLETNQASSAPAPAAAAPAQAPPAAPSTPGQYRMCIPGEEGNEASFLQKCNAAMALANDAAEGVSFSCIAGGSEEGCMKLVRDGGAELTKFGPSYVYIANRDYGLEPIVSENYGAEAGKEYYSVAVVKKEFCDTPNLSLSSLKGKSSCHTGYRKTAGWNMPVGYLVDAGVMDVENSESGVNTDAESVAGFFSKVCSPRVTADGPKTDGTAWDPLCTACGGDCTEDSPYYDYAGTIRGLNDNVCDVAFTKHSTAAEVARDGSAPEPWATLSKDDLRLLCPLGGCAPVTDFQRCNFAGVPSQAIVGAVALQRTPEGAKVKEALVNAGKNPRFLEAAADIDGSSGFILTANTKSLDVSF